MEEDIVDDLSDADERFAHPKHPPIASFKLFVPNTTSPPVKKPNFESDDEATIELMPKSILKQNGSERSEPTEPVEYNTTIINESMHLPSSKRSASRNNNANATFDERQKKFIEKKRAKEAIAAVELLAEEQAKCTFTPKVNNEARRDLETFLKSQEEFLERKAEKINSVKSFLYQHEASFMQSTPKINPNASLLVAKRLRGQSTEKKLAVQEVETLLPKRTRSRTPGLVPSKTSVKSIKKSREQREQNEQKAEAEKRREIQKTKGNQLLLNKVSRELEQACVSCNGNTSDPIKYTTLYSILEAFGIITGTNDKSKAHNERKLIVKLWEVLEGEKRGGVSFVDLKTVISCVLGMNPGCAKKTNSKGFGKYVDDTYVVSEKEAEELHRYFKAFYLNKMSKKKPVQKSETNYLHNPKVNETSARMAGKMREKWKALAVPKEAAQKTKPTLADLLITVKKAQERQSLERRKKKEQEELKSCTFRPKISHYNGHKQVVSEAKQNKGVALYNYSKIAKKKMDKTTEEVEYERQKDELTFQPNISSRRQKTPKRNKSGTRHEKGYTNSVERIKKARQEKEYVELAKTLGTTLNRAKSIAKNREKSSETSTCRYQRSPPEESSSVMIKESAEDSKIPILEIEMKISEDVKETCVIYSGQTAEEVAEMITKKHALSEDAKQEIICELEKQFKSLGM